MADIICAHLPEDIDLWRNDATVKLSRCPRCHAQWPRGAAPPRVVVAILDEEPQL